MAVRIEDVQLAKSQRSYRVRLGTDWYGAYLKYKPDQPPILAAIGKMVEVETETLEKGGPWVKAWTFASDQTLPAGARPVTPHQGAEKPGAVTYTRESENAASSAERQLSAEELKVVNGIVMNIIEHGPMTVDTEIVSYTDYLERVQLAMKAIATTVREL